MEVREATEKEAEENMRKQAIMAKYGINVKIDGSWGPWQQQQWESLQPRLLSDISGKESLQPKPLANMSAKESEKQNCHPKYELWLGIFFIVPAILGVVSFILSLFDADTDFSDMSDLRGVWADGEYVSSPAPVFIGLMAIAGVMLIKDYLNHSCSKQ